ncbi:helix-turn-helix domain-containing protein [Stackebrandtia soli]|uniref:helix-turn-helix domain-containing protein n=1 Tax=Stackebrandtia soli TaxID=1892856 RepID=UPI0039E8502F
MRNFLELLEREASAVEFDEPIAAARAAGASAEELAELQRAQTIALRVRETMTTRARRGAELSAAFELAADLPGLRDLDAVLDTIARHARQLLRTDVAYLTLHDEARGDTYMRVTNGSVSAPFQRVRLPMGIGLGGLVAQHATPYASSDYFADDRFDHSDDVDVAVRDEGLVAILGVPLRLGQRTIGVLFAADRRPRRFLREEVALLGSLAVQAAVAIDNARLLDETRAALAELSEANSLVRAHSDAVERAALAHDRMAQLVLGGGGIAEVAAIVTGILGGALVVLDAIDRPVCAIGEVGELTPRVFEAARTACALGRAVRADGAYVAAVEADGAALCTFVLRTDAELADIDQRILERAVLVAALLTLMRRSAADAEDRFRGELLDDLIAYAGGDSEGLRDRANRVGVDLDAPHVVVVATHDGARQRAAFWASSHATLESGLAAVRARELVLLVPGSEAGAIARRIADELGASIGRPVAAGGSGPVSGADAVAVAYREARRCADTVTALGRTGGASAADLGFVGLLVGDGRDVGAFIDATVGPVVAYDARRKTALVDTLVSYFGTGGSLSRAADELHIHVNTVTQRLERVTNLLGADWQRPQRALEIQLALRLHRIRGVV